MVNMTSSNPTEPLACVVVGGGVAGLTAALHLAERGLKPLVLEADPAYLGGRWASRPATKLIDSNGREWSFPAEHGIHGFWWQYKNLKAMMNRHNFMPKLVFAERQMWVHSEKGKIKKAEMGRAVIRTWWPAPFHYGTLFFRPAFLKMLTLRDFISIPRVLGSMLIATGVDPLVEGRSLEGFTLADFAKGWPPRLTAFLATLGRSGLSAHPEGVPLAGFIAFLRFYTVLRRDSQKYHYLPADPESCLIGPLVRKIIELGGEIRTGTRVEKLERQGETGWMIHPAQGQAFPAQRVILATDAPATSRILNASGPTAEIASGLKWPEGRKTVAVRLWFTKIPAKKQAEAGVISGEFTIDNFFWLHRIQDVYAEWHKATGGGAMEAHIYAQEHMDLDDTALMARAQDDIFRIYPELKGQIVHATLQRNDPTHTLFGIGSLSQHIGVHTPWPGLSCCGDWVRNPIPALFLERACATGIIAANSVLEPNGLPPFTLEKYDRPEILARITGAWTGSMRGTGSPKKAKK